MITKPCLACGEPTEGSRCPDCRPPGAADRTHPALKTARWQRISRRLRKASPFCQACGATTNLHVDHIIPLGEDDSLAYELLNLRVLCRDCNLGRRRNTTDDERQAVHAAIRRRRRRLPA